MKTVMSLVMAVAWLGAANSFAADVAKTTTPVQQSLAGVPAAELPAKAADLVKSAKSRDRGFVTVDVVKAAVNVNPAATPAIVGAIAKAVPDMASIAAGTAADLQPKQASAIAKAAAAAAPSKAGKIVAAVCRAVPQDYRSVALTVAATVPGSGKEVLKGVASAFPELKPGIENALGGYAANSTSVSAVLDSVKPAVVSAQDPAAPMSPAGSVRGPSVTAPYVPLSGTPATVTPSTSGTVPANQRNYATP